MNKEVMLSCPEGFQPPFTHVKCIGKNVFNSNGKLEYREVWLGKDSRRWWNRIRDKVVCTGKGGIRSRMVLCGDRMLGLRRGESQHGKVTVFP